MGGRLAPSDRAGQGMRLLTLPRSPPVAGTSASLAAAVDSELVSLGMKRAKEHGWQDTYVFTKAMGEMLLRREAEARGIPCCIVRPSIVESTWREPVSGWMEGIRMCDPIILVRLPGVLPTNGFESRPLMCLPRALLPPGIRQGPAGWLPWCGRRGPRRRPLRPRDKRLPGRHGPARTQRAARGAACLPRGHVVRQPAAE